ncbi:hypothetical protein I6A84_02140 [Frankia sp. CNm7]|uniref:Lecithin:cholesterol acyltransferase n=1 Tax=Frankia nepalensis TaxID=1836974 RepID=A0A937R4Q1_9ACTN|nr:hypothetical protein [Frankia nepalensis]MBL7499863.1 hypothetical protein [Frankia nepalensis]MBL7512319.1 hypothetical protein [Frankia nepalensis]MBL7516957.1 hypothetical protein [Frankia nepalensis]MBL7625728.1 hypothetical protein [Frankia nepalensis]
MAKRAAFNDLLIVVPGIGGSMLRDNEGPLWNPTLRLAGALLVRHGGLIERLAKDNRHLADPAFESEVQPYGLIEMGVTIPGLAGINCYKPLREALLTSLDLEPGDPVGGGPPANYFEFAYDWRRDVSISAEQLKRMVLRELPRWNRLLPPGERARTVIVAHSMGGLVAKHYLVSRDSVSFTSFDLPLE